MTEKRERMNEAELRMLLEQGERPVSLSSEQRDRILRSIDQATSLEQNRVSHFAAPVLSEKETERVEPIDAILDEPPHSGSRGLLLAAAISGFVILVGLFALSVRSNEVESVAEPQDTRPSVTLVECPAEITEFLDAIESWGDVENWSFVTDSSSPEPDLLTLSIAALQSELMSDVADEGLIEELQTLSGPSPGNLTASRPVDREQRFEAVSAAEMAVTEALRNNPSLANCAG